MGRHCAWLTAVLALTAVARFSPDCCGALLADWSQLLTLPACCRPAAGSLYLINRNTAPSYTTDGHSWRAKERHMNLKCNGKDAVVCYYSMPKDGAEQVRGGAGNGFLGGEWMCCTRSV